MRLRSSAAFNGCCWIVFAGAERLRWRPAMGLEGRRVLYISYNGMLDPLGQSQVIPYLKELNQQGVEFTLLSCERPEALAKHGEQHCKQMRAELAVHGIDWHWLRYHKTPSLPATSYDVFAGIRYGTRLMR